MKIRIRDSKVPGEDLVLILDESLQDDDSAEEAVLTEEQAFQVVEFWESSDQVGARGSYDLTEDGILVLGEVETLGDDIELFAWYQGDFDGTYELSSFPCTTLEWVGILEVEVPKKFGELRSYPGMNGIPVTEGD